MLRRLHLFFFTTLRGRLIVGVAAVHAVMMALFIVDLTVRQRSMLLERQTEQAVALSRTLAVSAAGWIASDDLAGLQELVTAQREHQELVFAILTNDEGKVLAHSDPAYRGKYLLNLPSGDAAAVIMKSEGLVDVISPAMLGTHRVGWARVGVGQKMAAGKLTRIISNGVLYAMLAILFGSLIAWLMGNRITRRLYAIQQTMDQIGAGNTKARSTLKGQDEAADIAAEFNAMLDRLAEREGALSQLNTRLEQELTERKHAEDEIQHLKNYLANIIDSMPSLLVGIDRGEQVVLWNRQSESMTGIPAADAVGRSIHEMLPDFSHWIEALHHSMQERQPSGMEKLLLEHNGERNFYDLMLYPLVANGVEGAVIRIEDVTERTRVQTLMVQTEKMMSVGGLAAGMAHEINNPLGIIIQAAHNIERRLDPSFPPNQVAAQQVGCRLEVMQAYFVQRQIPQFIASICESSARAARIIRNILDFSRSAEATMVVVSLSEVLEQTIELAGSDYDLKKRYDFRSIKIVREYDPSLPPVKGILVELEQVFLNLLKNAAQAMIANPAGQPPQIVLRLYRQGEYAVAEVEDNGPGMAEEIRRRVFEPFFTTKEPGIGTGLGLSVSYMIVTQNHKGLLEAVSRPDRGACFSVKLPLPREEQHA
jgi:PAS domain S-box-containing protein